MKTLLMHIKRALNRRKIKGITFIGSGNYHYVSYFIIRRNKQAFTLILFDHHTDMNLQGAK